VYDATTGNPLYATLKFDKGHKSEDGKSMYFKESELSNVAVTVSAKNYETRTIQLNLSNSEIKVELYPEQHTYTFKIPLANGGYITTLPYTTQERLTECPIKGYKCERTIIQEGEDKPNYVRFIGQSQAGKDHHGHNPLPSNGNPSNVGEDNEPNGGDTPTHLFFWSRNIRKLKKHWKCFLGVIMALAIIAALLFVAYTLFFKKDNHTHYSGDDNNSAAIAEDKSTWDAAKAYLDSCQAAGQTKWVKSEMEQYKELQGLYDLINNYRFKEIVSFMDKHKEDYMDIDSYKRLYDIASKSRNKEGRYYDDGTITIENYLKKFSSSIGNAEATGASESSTDSQQSKSSAKSSGVGNTGTDESKNKGATDNANGNNATTTTTSNQDDNV